MNHVLEKLFERHAELNFLQSKITAAAGIIIDSYKSGGKVLICGNGGSSSDSGHIAGELMKGFVKRRPLGTALQEKIRSHSPEYGAMLTGSLQQGLPAISLSAHTGLLTAIINDINGDLVFAQQVTGYGKEGDVLLGLSSSGNAKDVLYAFIVAKAMGLKTIGMTGASGGKMKGECDVLINVPETETYLVQELHLPVYHAICLMVEGEFFNL
jgi:D-sedoheptulose 7-phosphate isomerase